jgi:hypothetical protein
MATSLAATIKSEFGIDPELIEGHNGIYEVSTKNQVAYTNKSVCNSGFPGHQEIIESISRVTGLTPKRGFQEFPKIQGNDPVCRLPGDKE